MRRTTWVVLVLSGAVAVGWAVLLALAAWGVWHNADNDRDLLAHGRRAPAVVGAVSPAVEVRLGLCRSSLQATSPGLGPVTVAAATRWCAQPWTPGEALDVVVDPAHPAGAVVAEDQQGWWATAALPVLVIGLAAVVAGYPLGRFAGAVRRWRDGERQLDLTWF